MKYILFLLLTFQLFSFCGPPSGDDLFNPPRNLGKVSEKLSEASGLVSSVENEGKLWTINDSGNDATVFLINQNAKIELSCMLLKAKNRDWEDITIGKGPVGGINYLYVGDIGDNNGKYKLKYIYRFPEPALSEKKKIEITVLDTLIIKLPGHPRDTETMMIDPISNDLFLISKREEEVHLYQTSFPYSKGIIMMRDLGKIPFKLIVAGSISNDGLEVVIKNYNKIYYWKRNPGESIPSLLLREPTHLSYEPEHQGEAIAWANDRSGFFTLSESSVVDRAQLRFYQRKTQPAK